MLSEHVQNKHGNSIPIGTTPIFYCGCGKVYEIAKSLTRHVKDKHYDVRPEGTTPRRQRGRPQNSNLPYKFECSCGKFYPRS